MTGEFPDVCGTVIRKARKEHVCCECKQTIHPKELYQEVKGCWNGKWATYKTCEPCAELRDELSENLNSGENIAFGYLDEAADNAGVPFPTT